MKIKYKKKEVIFFIFMIICTKDAIARIISSLFILIPFLILMMRLLSYFLKIKSLKGSIILLFILIIEKNGKTSLL